jgi:pimeloyl-ACP methyl ester carboxylesterase
MARRALLLTLLLVPAIAAAAPRWETLPLPPAMPVAATTGHVEINAAHIYYATFGKGEPVVLLHGGLGNSDHWAFQVPELAKQYQVIVIDSRNQGRSTLTKSKAKLTYHAMADDVLAVLDQLGIQKAAMIGWSDGGEIGLDLAIHNPNRLSKLFVFGANYDVNQQNRRAGGSQTMNARGEVPQRLVKMSKDPTTYKAVVDSLMPVWKNRPDLKDQLRGSRHTPWWPRRSRRARRARSGEGDGEHADPERQARRVRGHLALRAVAGPGLVQQGASRVPFGEVTSGTLFRSACPSPAISSTATGWSPSSAREPWVKCGGRATNSSIVTWR